jgi:methyl-CpG-binding domain protein 4
VKKEAGGGAKGGDQAMMTAFFKPQSAGGYVAHAQAASTPAGKSPMRSSPRRKGQPRGQSGSDNDKESKPVPPHASFAGWEADARTDSPARKEEGFPAEVKKEEQEGAETDGKGLSEYEMMRQANIRRNNALLESLDIPSSAIPVAEVQASQKKTCKKRKSLLALEECMEPRRSGRRLALAEKDKSDPLVALPDSWDEQDEEKQNTAASSKRLASMQIVEDTDWESLEAPPSMLDVLQQLAAAQTIALGKWGSKATDWKQFAIDKWGPLVACAKVSDWQEYVSSRCPVVPMASGSDMLQERFCGDVWQLLVSCLLMTRVSSQETKDRALAGFFDAFPSPSAFKVSQDEEVFEIIKSLGLFDTRIRGLRDVTQRFLSMPRFIIGMDKDIKPYGCGPFVYESYLIFCCGHGCSIQASDKNLRAYCAWLRRMSDSSFSSEAPPVAAIPVP